MNTSDVYVRRLEVALAAVLESCDRVSGDPKSVVRWNNLDVIVLSAARKLLTESALPPVNPPAQEVQP